MYIRLHVCTYDVHEPKPSDGDQTAHPTGTPRIILQRLSPTVASSGLVSFASATRYHCDCSSDRYEGLLVEGDLPASVAFDEIGLRSQKPPTLKTT